MARRIGEFTIFRTIDEFRAYIDRSTFARRIAVIQNHHTFIPAYASFSDISKNYLTLLRNMESAHINERRWQQIGQNITTFPDGAIALCRPIDSKPAGIFGANTGAICLEHVGFFDLGKDAMRPEHRESIIQCNAILCRKFKLPVTTQHVVYHHWYDANGNRFADSFVNTGRVQALKLQKSCPGTAFFNGNTVSDAINHFLPFIRAAVNQPDSFAAPSTPVVLAAPTQKIVKATVLNVRAGRGKAFSIVRQLPFNTPVNVYLTQDGWSRIDPLREEWVAANYLRE